MSQFKDTDIGPIPNEWEISNIGSVADVTKLAGYEYTEYFEYSENDEIIALRALNVREGVLDLENVKYISRDISEALPRSKLLKHDLLFTYIGANIGQFAIVPENDRFHLAPNICRFRCNRNYHYYFLYSYMRSSAFRDSLEGYSHGSSQPTLPMGIIRTIPVPVPPLPEQKAIASVLSSLDDKIDLLHRQNKTLEAMAETLFRQWFIEEAKEDWDDFLVADIATHVKDNVTPSKAPLDLFHHFSLPAYDSGLNPSIELGSEILSNKYRISADSILVSKLNPRVPRVWLLRDVQDNFVCSTEFQNLKPNDVSHLMFLYGLFKSREVIDELSMSASGTSGSHQRVRPDDMLNIRFSAPNFDYLTSYAILVEKKIQKVMTNRVQIQTLEKLRDTLLPKLMSGEVRVKYEA